MLTKEFMEDWLSKQDLREQFLTLYSSTILDTTSVESLQDLAMRLLKATKDKNHLIEESYQFILQEMKEGEY